MIGLLSRQLDNKTRKRKLIVHKLMVYQLANTRFGICSQIPAATRKAVPTDTRTILRSRVDVKTFVNPHRKPLCKNWTCKQLATAG
jgi:hypothetical protein